MNRARWQSRSVFVLAAIGSAVGLGNIWRFPYLAYKFGGGAFLVPYLCALFLIGIPLLTLEFALGQRFQRGAVQAYAAIHRRFRGLGWFALATGFVIVSYYAVVMAWALLYLFASPTVAWGDDPSAYFHQEILQLTPSVAELGGMNWPILAALLVVWVLIYFCVWQGVKSVGRVIWLTVPLPLLLLGALFIRAITLPGFLTGWEHYLRPDWSALLSGEVWLAATAQIFFTLTLGFGVMIAYASHKDTEADVAQDTLVTALCNSAISLFAGFVVFGILGYMAVQTQVPVDEVATAGPGLAFVAFPRALSLMPWPGFFSVLFFVILLTLGIDSAFSLIEGVNVAVRDSRADWSPALVALGVCGAACAAGVIFTTRAGLYLLDIVDHYATSYSLILVGILECILVGWLYSSEALRRYVNSVSNIRVGRLFNVAIQFIIPLALVTLLVVQLSREFQEPYGGYPGWAQAIGWVAVAVPLLLFVIGAWRGAGASGTRVAGKHVQQHAS